MTGPERIGPERTGPERTGPLLRRAVPSDAATLARIHHQVWLECYGQIAAPQAIAALTEAHRLAAWQRTLAADDPVTLMAEVAGAVQGFVCYGAPTDPVYGNRGEIRHLYLLPKARGQGLGLRLLTEALLDLHAKGFPGAALAVVEENTRARAFYASVGGVEELAFTDKGPLWLSRNRLVGWHFAS